MDRISSLSNKKGSSTLNTLNYTYDNAGRLNGVSGWYTRGYQYDSLGRLSRENNSSLSKTVTYYWLYEPTYPRYTLRVDTYGYTTAATITTARIQTEFYLYNNNGWWDQLSYIHTYDNNWNFVPSKSYSYTYDALGNLTSVSCNGQTVTYSWTRGSMLANANGASYKYGINGLRTEKTVNGITTQYFWHGNQLYAENRGGIWIEYYYDATGIRGMNYGGTKYIFIKNELGDIIQICNESGTIVGHYRYDAYGNFTISIDSNGIATNNPFRYRGYYYDNETGNYYLRSRYYSPKMLSFVSPDDPLTMLLTSSVPGEGTDLYAYCLNDPIGNIDPNGSMPFCIYTAGIGALLGFGIGLAIGYWGYDVTWDDGLIWWGLGGAAVGGLIGLVVGMGISYHATGSVWSNLTSIRIGFAAKAGDIEKIARLATHNKGANSVTLGKYPEYIKAANQNNSTYYSMNQKMWNRLNSQGIDMWKVNEAFLNQQAAAGKTFYAVSTMRTGIYAREIAFLLEVFGIIV